MRSLRNQLGIWLFCLSTTVGLLAAAISFTTARNEAWRFFDQQLRVMAHNVGVVTADRQGVEPIAPSDEPEDDFVVQVWDAGGQLLQLWPADASLPKSSIGGFHDAATTEGRWRCYTVVTNDHTIQVSQRFDVRDELAREAALRSLTPITATIPLAWLILHIVINRIMGQLERAAEALTLESGANSKIAISELPQEVRPFVASVNAALERQQTAVTAQRRFVADAAHALRTPLAVLQAQIENLRPEMPGEDRARRVEELDRGVARATALVRQLLRMARSQTNGDQRRIEAVDLVAVATQSMVALLPLADQHRHDFGLLRSDPAHVMADPDDARCLVDTILDNAIRYTPDGGVIDVSIMAGNCGVTFEVRDTGRGIPDDEIGRVLEPFYRAAPTHIEGSGLGLSIATAVADRCGARLALRNREDRRGLVVEVVFPSFREVASA